MPVQTTIISFHCLPNNNYIFHCSFEQQFSVSIAFPYNNTTFLLPAQSNCELSLLVQTIDSSFHCFPSNISKLLMIIQTTVPCFYCLLEQQLYVSISCLSIDSRLLLFVPRTISCFYCLSKQQLYIFFSCPSNHSKMSFLVKSTVPSWRNNNSMFSLLVPSTVICCHWWFKKNRSSHCIVKQQF